MPFDYLIEGKALGDNKENTNYGPTDLFLWRDGIGDETNAIKREQIESIEVKPSDKVSESAIYSWDVSENKTRKVMAWYEDIDNNGLYEVYIGQNGGVKSKGRAQNLFAYLSNAVNIDLEYFDTSQVTSMNSMFRGCKIASLDLSSFNTSKVTTMANMFNGCKLLKMLDVSNFDTTKVIHMESMFHSCKLLTSLDLSNFNTSKVINMTNMFINTRKLKPIYVGENFKITNTTTNMFSNSATESIEQLCEPESMEEWCILTTN